MNPRGTQNIPPNPVEYESFSSTHATSNSLSISQLHPTHSIPKHTEATKDALGGAVSAPSICVERAKCVVEMAQCVKVLAAKPEH